MRGTYAVVALIISGSSAFAGEFSGVLKNNEGVRSMKEKKVGEAFERFAQGTAADPYRAEIHFNLGYAYEQNKEAEKAIREYSTALKLAQDPETKFQALFNSARLSGEAKQIDLALNLYQQALEIHPDSKEVKTNIELLTKQQQGGGQGQSQQQDQDSQGKQKNDGQQQDQQQQQPQPKEQQGQKQNPRPTPRPFKSEQLSQQDVGRILEELKRQEESVRSKFQNEGAKDVPRDKDW